MIYSAVFAIERYRLSTRIVAPLVMHDELAHNQEPPKLNEVTIDGVVFENIRLESSDERRDLSVFFDHELRSANGFMEGRLLEIHQNCILGGGHVHGHSEVFMVIRGSAMFTLYHEHLPDMQNSILLLPGHKLIIPAGVAHTAVGSEGSLIIAISERPYDGSPDHTRPAIKSQ